MTDTVNSGPLAGLRIVDFGQYLAGPGAAMILADQGADVIKVERPGGPSMNSPANAVLNRGKHSIVLDLKTPEGGTAALDLIANADVVIENFRPGVMSRLGLGPDALMRLNPRLVYLSLPGFSHGDTENAGKPAWEAVIAAAMGQFTDMGLNRVLMGVEASYSPLALASAYASVFGAMAVVLALRAREVHGLGDYVEVPLAAALMEGLAYNSMWLENTPDRYKSLREREIERRRTAGLPLDLSYAELQPFLEPFYRTYMCRDGRPIYVVSASHVSHPQRVLKTLGIWDEMVATGLPQHDAYVPMKEWPEGTDCSITASTITEPWATLLATRMAQAFLTKDSTEWERLFGEAGAPVAAHRTTREWIHSDHVRKAGLIVEIDDPQYGPMLQPGPLVWLKSCPPVVGHGTKYASNPMSWAQPRQGSKPASTVAAGRTPWLQGITILDLTNMIAGPTIAATLARFGAKVTKIDMVKPTFDPWSTIGIGIYSNRGKDSALVDIKTSKGQDILRALIAQVDVITINATDKQLPGLNLEFEALQKINPRVILCQLDAFSGPSIGPHSNYLGYDDIIQAASGITERFGGSMATVEEHAHFGTIDVLAGLSAAVAVSIALLRREKTGRGDVARSSLAAAGQWIQSRFLYDFKGRPPFVEARGPTARGEGPLYRCYRAADRWFFLAANDAFLEKAATTSVLGSVSAANDVTLETELESIFKSKPLTYWEETLPPLGAAVQALESMAVVRSASVASPGNGRTIEFQHDEHHPIGRSVEHIRPMAIRPLHAPIVATSSTEKYGNSTRRILSNLGYSEIQIDEMRAQHVISDSWSADYLPD